MKLFLSLFLPLLSCVCVAGDHRKLFREVNPSVVEILTVEREVSPESYLGEVTMPGLGSGVLIDNQGHVMTAAHVVQTADLVEVEFADGAKVTAAIVASDPARDVALIKLDSLPNNARPARLGNSDKMEVGEEIIVVGAPFGLSHTLTVGHISARHEADSDFMSEIQAEMFQTDAAINQGNSGGPMFNLRGEVIGIVSHIRSRSGGSDGLGFAITTNTAVEALINRPMVWSGMTGVLLIGPLANALNIPQDSGYLVQKVASNSPASRAGLRPSRMPIELGGQQILIGGDIILSVGEVEIAPGMNSELEELRDRIEPDRQVVMKVLRDGKIIALRTTL